MSTIPLPASRQRKLRCLAVILMRLINVLPLLLLLLLLLLTTKLSSRANGLNLSSLRVRRRIWRSLPTTTRTVSIPVDMPEQNIHVKMMGYALDEARQAGQMGEVPIGAVVVKELTTAPPPLSITDTPATREFELISTGRNLVETKMDASAHAELEAMKVAASRTKNWHLLNTTLYSTLEPCPMCLAAAQAFRCKSVVYGAPDLRLGAVKTHVKLLEMAKHPYHEVEAIGGVLEEESAAVLRAFFRARRGQIRATIPPGGEEGKLSQIFGRMLGLVKRLNPFQCRSKQ